MTEIKTVEDLIREIESQDDGVIKDGKGTGKEEDE